MKLEVVVMFGTADLFVHKIYVTAVAPFTNMD